MAENGHNTHIEIDFTYYQYAFGDYTMECH